jgi:EAL domain-containing protein (putative c-di-GMP-specific phosphodiesterase class I)
VNVTSGEIIGAEVLIRWEHPERGLISPAEFIPVLESSGLIVDVGRWIIRESCQNLQQMVEQGLWAEGMRLSVNISPRQFSGQDFVNDVDNILKHVDIPDNSLDFEVTESVVIHNVEETISTMTTLTSMGISFSLDDFGTGYSSISYLKRLPVSTLKVDYSFVRDIVDDHSDRVLVETIITMGKLLNLDVVAEGVEELAQLTMLADFGCHYYQGFYFSRPVPLGDFMSLLLKA